MLYTDLRIPPPQNDEKLCNIVKALKGHFVMVGDFNYPGIRWETGGSDAKSRLFYDAFVDGCLTQHVEVPTHISGNILDLVITGDDEVVNCVDVGGRLGKSDHEMITVAINTDLLCNDKDEYVRDYKKANYREMRGRITSINWFDVFSERSVEECWSFLKTVLNELIDSFVPLKRKRNAMAPLWLDKEVKVAVREKKKAWDKWKKTKKEEEKKAYKTWENKVKKLIRNKKNAVERDAAKDCKSNPKRFYSYINSARRSRSTIGPLKCGDELVVDPQRQANVLNEYYSSVFTRNSGIPPTLKTTCSVTLDDIDFTEELVSNAIDRLREFSAPGPDGVTNKIMIELKCEIVVPLTLLFRKSMHESRIPNEWRLSNVSPIFKKGSKAEPGNYRPVSLTSNVCKLMERVVNVFLSAHLNNNVLNNTQHGFRKGRSCQTSLIEFMDKVTEWTDEGNNVDILYLDFSKAFDKVNHDMLMVKLKAAGIDGKLWAWLKDWLSGRKQRVTINGKFSAWLAVESGVPQGTVLGGPLFTVYNKDIDELIKLFLRKFADDLKAAGIVNNTDQARFFQENIDLFVEWAKKWLMEFNIKKCKIMHLGKSNPRVAYYMDGVMIAETEAERDLGVWFDTTLKPSLQCEIAAKEANKVLGLIGRSFHFRTRQTLVTLYKTVARPKLEFSVAAWSPWLEKDVECLEKVQRRLVRMLSNIKGDSYESKLENAGLTTLKARRERGDAIQAFKVLNGFDRVNKNDWFLIPATGSDRPSTRSNTVIQNGNEAQKSDAVLRERARTEIRNHSYRLRTARLWSDIPDSVKSVKSVNAFKNSYDVWRKQSNSLVKSE